MDGYYYVGSPPDVRPGIGIWLPDRDGDSEVRLWSVTDATSSGWLWGRNYHFTAENDEGNVRKVTVRYWGRITEMTDVMSFGVAVVQVVLRSQQRIESPILPRDEAESALSQIGEAREQGDSVSLPWLSVEGGDVEAVHLQERAS